LVVAAAAAAGGGSADATGAAEADEADAEDAEEEGLAESPLKAPLPTAEGADAGTAEGPVIPVADPTPLASVPEGWGGGLRDAEWRYVSLAAVMIAACSDTYSIRPSSRARAVVSSLAQVAMPGRVG
jgi:hypothetical protein